MARKYLKYIPIFIILLVGSMSLFWTNTHFLLSIGDYVFPQERLKEFFKMLNVWDSTILGVPTFMITLGLPIPYGIYLVITSILTISPIQSQAMWSYFLFISLGLSMYFLVTQLMNTSAKYAAGLLSALFFMFSPWGAINIIMFVPYVTFIPFILGLYIKGLRENKGIRYITFISIIWFFISSFSLWNIRGFVFQWMMLIFYLIIFCLHNRNRVLKAVVFTFILFILYALLNCYWLLPFILNISKSITASSDVYSVINYTKLDSFKVNSSTMSYVLRLLDNWSLTANFKGTIYYAWLTFYLYPLPIIIGFLPIVAVLSSMLFIMRGKIKARSEIIFFFFLLLFGFL